MRSLILSILTFGVVVVCITTLLQLRAEYIFADSNKQIDFYRKGKSIGSESVDSFLDPEISEESRLKILQEGAEQSSSVLFALPKALDNLSYVLRRRAMSSSTRDERISLFCGSLSATGKEIVSKPTDARLLINWASMRQLLGNLSCSDPYTAGSYVDTVRLALELNPTDTQVKYSAGLLLLRAGDQSKARRLFRDVLLYEVNPSSNQTQFIFSQVTNVASLKELIPARFPQLLDFSKAFDNGEVEDRSSPERAALVGALSEMQIEAVRASQVDYRSGEIPKNIHLARLLQIQEVSADDQARVEIDKILADIMQRSGDVTAADYLTFRSGLKKLTIIRSTIPSDTRPNKTSLIEWERNEAIAFDEFYRSIGFFLPDGQTLKLLEIVGRKGAGLTSASAIRVFNSRDNKVWTEVGPDHRSEVISYGGQVRLTVRVTDGRARYWKVNFARASRDKTVVNYLDELIEAYGNSIRN